MWLLGPVAFWVALSMVGALVPWLAGANRATVVLGAAPAAVVALIAIGLAQEVLPIRLGWGPLAIVATVMGLAARVGRRLALTRLTRSRTGSRSGPTDVPAGPLVVTLVLLLVGGCLVLWLAGGHTWETVSQTWDAFFDANAVRAAASTGSVAPTRLSDFSSPVPTGGYYPSAFHAVAALYMVTAHSDAVVGTNVAAAGLAGLVWPSVAGWSVLRLVGRGWSTAVVGAVVAVGTWGLPWAPLGWGVLWATALAGAFVPYTLVALLGVLGLVPADDRAGQGDRPRDLLHPNRRPAWMGLVGATVVLGLLHPRVLTVTTVVAVAFWSCVWGWRAYRNPERTRLLDLALAGVPVLGLGVAALFVGRHAESLQWRIWPNDLTWWQEVWGYVIAGPASSVPVLPLAVLVLLGAVVAARGGRLRWLVVLYVCAVAVDIATASSQLRAVGGLTRFWYSDRHRSATVPPFAAVLLAVVGWHWVGERLRERGLRERSRASLAATALVVLLGWGLTAGLDWVGRTYATARDDARESVVSPREVAFYHRIADVVGKDERILNNARDGSGLIYAYVDRKPVFYLANNAPSTFSGLTLRDELIHMNPLESCTLLNGAGIRWVFNGGRTYSTDIIKPAEAPGMQIPDGFPVTTPVLADGDLRLYRVTGCGPTG